MKCAGSKTKQPVLFLLSRMLLQKLGPSAFHAMVAAKQLFVKFLQRNLFNVMSMYAKQSFAGSLHQFIALFVEKNEKTASSILKSLIQVRGGGSTHKIRTLVCKVATSTWEAMIPSEF